MSGPRVGRWTLRQGMQRLRAWCRHHPAWALFAASVLVCDVWLLSGAWRLCAHKAYAIDEFYYTHRAWALLAGEGGFWGRIAAQRLFVSSLLLAPLAALGGNDPAQMILVRKAMFPCLLLTLACLAWLCYRREPVHRAAAALVGVLFALSAPRFLWHAVEIRVDGIALMWLMCCLALLHLDARMPRLLAAVAGVSLLLCCLTTSKAIVYCSVFAPALLMDLYTASRGEAPRILRRPGYFVLGFATGLLALLAVLCYHHALGGFVGNLLRGPLQHEQYYPRMPKGRYLLPYLATGVHLWAVALLGLAIAMVGGVRAWKQQRVFVQEWLPIMLYFSTLGSFLLQKAAYPYSLLAWSGIQCLFAARGILAVIAHPRLSTAMRRMLLGGCAVGIPAIVWASGFLRTPPYTNRRQIELQGMIGRLVDVTDTVYDMSAAYVYRPQGHEFAFVDTARRVRYWAELNAEVPRALIENETMLFVYDTRFHTAPEGPLKQFIRRHYQRYNNDLFIWGRRWEGNGQPWSDTFRALKTADYFVFPPRAAAGVLDVDGRPITRQVFHLDRGEHRVCYRPGEDAPRELFLIWLPRDGRTFDPTRPAPPYYLGRHILP